MSSKLTSVPHQKKHFKKHTEDTHFYTSTGRTLCDLVPSVGFTCCPGQYFLGLDMGFSTGESHSSGFVQYKPILSKNTEGNERFTKCWICVIFVCLFKLRIIISCGNRATFYICVNFNSTLKCLRPAVHQCKLPDHYSSIHHIPPDPPPCHTCRSSITTLTPPRRTPHHPNHPPVTPARLHPVAAGGAAGDAPRGPARQPRPPAAPPVRTSRG